MNPHQEEQALGKVYDTELLKRLIPFVAPHWALVVFSLVLIPLRALLAVIPPVLIGAALNYLVEGTAKVDVPWLEPLVEPRFRLVDAGVAVCGVVHTRALSDRARDRPKLCRWWFWDNAPRVTCVPRCLVTFRSCRWRSLIGTRWGGWSRG